MARSCKGLRNARLAFQGDDDFETGKNIANGLTPPPTAPRKQIIEAVLENHRKLEPAYLPFMEKLKEYYDRTGDPRAASMLAREKVIVNPRLGGIRASPHFYNDEADVEKLFAVLDRAS